METTFKKQLLETIRAEQNTVLEMERMLSGDSMNNESYAMAREFTKLCCIETLIETLRR